MVTVIGCGLCDTRLNPEQVYISRTADILEKGMNSTIPPSAGRIESAL